METKEVIHWPSLGLVLFVGAGVFAPSPSPPTDKITGMRHWPAGVNVVQGYWSHQQQGSYTHATRAEKQNKASPGQSDTGSGKEVKTSAQKLVTREPQLRKSRIGSQNDVLISPFPNTTGSPNYLDSLGRKLEVVIPLHSTTNPLAAAFARTRKFSLACYTKVVQISRGCTSAYCRSCRVDVVFDCVTLTFCIGRSCPVVFGDVILATKVLDGGIRRGNLLNQVRRDPSFCKPRNILCIFNQCLLNC